MTSETRRILALDLGDVRIGVAVSDPLGMTGQPLEALPRIGPRKDAGRIAALVGEWEVGTIVVGLPRLMSGAEGSAAAAAREFAGRLERRLPQVRVLLWDERLTTAQVEREMIAGGVRRARRREVVDGLAATLVLQSFLEASSTVGEPRAP